jgi:hypothetical protein
VTEVARDARAHYDEICIDLVARHREVESGKAMGMSVIKAYGKVIAAFSRPDDAMAFRLPDEGVRAEALALEGATPFDPTRRGRPFEDWVVVPARHASHWPRLAREALTLRAD